MTSKPADVLIVDDEDIVRALLAAQIGQLGVRVDTASSSKALFDKLGSKSFDLIVLDLGLPDEDGLVVLRQLRMTQDIPVLILTSRSESEDRLTGLELGADDYVNKAAPVEEIVLRVRNVLRRSSNSGARSRASAKAVEYRFDGWRLSVDNRALYDSADRVVDLTRSEFDVLLALIRAGGRILSRDQLIDALASQDEPPSDRMIDSFVSRIRRKMDTRQYVVTVTGIGYRFAGSLD